MSRVPMVLSAFFFNPQGDHRMSWRHPHAPRREIFGLEYTVGQGSDRTGSTATSVESLSVEPPRLLLCVSESSSSWKELQKCPYFGVNILRAGHLGLADQFAGRGGLQGADRFRGAQWTTLLSEGAAILKDALAGVDCVTEELLPRHGHVIIIGRVRAILLHADGQPLLYWQSAYRQIVHNQPDQQQ